MEDIRTFEIVMIDKPPDFSEIIEYFSNLDRKYYWHEISRLIVSYYDIGTVEVIFRKVNPEGHPVAKLIIRGYVKSDEHGYGGYNSWDARGVFKMICKEVLPKITLPNPTHQECGAEE